jgi:hypothetical protein
VTSGHAVLNAAVTRDAQFSSMYSWRSTGTSNYNGLQATLRRRVAGLEFDLNYTFSKSLDENSNAERVNEYENGSGSAVAYSGQVVNAWMPHQLYGPCDYDLRHQFNADWVHIRENRASETICAAQTTSASTQVSPNSGRSRRRSPSAFPGMLLMSPTPCALM